MKLENIMENLEAGQGRKTVVSVVGAGGKTTCVLELSRVWAEKGFQVLAGTTTHMEAPEVLGVNGVVGSTGEEILQGIRTRGWILAGEQSKTPGKIRGLSEKVWKIAEKGADRIVLEADGAKRFPVKVPQNGEPVIRRETTHILVFAGLSALGKPLETVCHRFREALLILGGNQDQILTAEKLGILLEQGYVRPLREKYPQMKTAVVLNQADLTENPENSMVQIKKQVSAPVFLRTREQEIHLIYLAAGFSKRFGSNKLLWEIEGKPMYRHLLDRLHQLRQEGKVQSLTVVTQYEEIERQMEIRKICTVRNPDSSRGISSSLRLGLEEAQKKGNRGEEQFYCFFVADQPDLEKETVENFLDAFLESQKGIGCVSFQGVPGNPVIFHEKYKEELLTLTGDTGGKRVLKRHLEDVFFYEVKKEEVKDWDYNEDSAGYTVRE